jgi:hypothetical protein
MKKENDRKIGLRYNENIGLFEKADKRMEGVSVLWHIRIKKKV